MTDLNDLQDVVIWHCSGLEVDEGQLTVRYEGKLIDLEPKARDLLLLLLRRYPDTVSDKEIEEELWQARHGHIHPKAASNAIGKIRGAIGREAHAMIKTVAKTGYRIAFEVTRQIVRRQPVEYPELKVGQAVRGRPSWILVERLATGGYGEAWLAENADTKDRSVYKFSFQITQSSALKREVTISRVLSAALQDRHDFVPIVASNFDQVPYWIESHYCGRNIKQWSDDIGGLNSVSIERRIDMVIAIADAMSAAHAIGVIHRDLKPENILVNEEQGFNRVRICDFGAGRLVDSSQLERLALSSVTVVNQSVIVDSAAGTAMYVAPELFAGKASGPQSDIFAIGVLLYQLVVGDLTRPMATGWQENIIDELLREDIADAVQGDPQRRLAYAQALADRLRQLPERRIAHARRQSEQELLARATKASEQAKQRRPWVIAIGALLLIGLSTVSYFWAAERRATGKAQAEARKEQAINEFLQEDILQPSSPVAGGAGTDTLKDALMRAIPMAQQQFANEPLQEAKIDVLMASSLSYYNTEQAALTLYRRAADIYSKEYGSNSTEAIQARAVMASTLIDMGHSKEGATELERVLPSLLGSPFKPSEAALDALAAKAHLAGYAGNKEEEIAEYQHLIDITERAEQTGALPEGIELLPQFQESLMLALNDAGHFAQSEQLGRQLLPKLQEKFHAEGNFTVMARVLIAGAVSAQQRYADAEPELTTLCKSMSAQAGEDDPNTSQCQSYLGRLYAATGRWNLAEPLFGQVYQNYLRQYAASSQDTIGARSEWAWSLDQVGRLADADAASSVSVRDAKSYLLRSSDEYAAALLTRARILAHLNPLGEGQELKAEFEALVREQHKSSQVWLGKSLLLDAEFAAGSEDRRAVLTKTTDAMAAIAHCPPYADQQLDRGIAEKLLANLSKTPNGRSIVGLHVQ